MTTWPLLYGLFCLIATVRAFKPGAFAIPIDLNDHYVTPGEGFTRQNGSMVCQLRGYECGLSTAATFQSPGYPVCVSGYFEIGGPTITDMYQSHDQIDLLTTHDKWCWDSFNNSAPAIDYQNISRVRRLDKLEIIVEPEIPKG